MFYTVYKITNRVNNKIYIGKHRTKDLNDKYMGSGKLIYSAIKKYGKENFTKQVLFVYDNEKEMNSKEKELVNENFVKSRQSYNIALGGKGGFSPTHDNSTYGKLGGEAYAYRLKTDPEFEAKESEKRKKAGLKGCEKGGQSYAYKMKTNPEFNQEQRELRRKKPVVI